ncbi:prephenate dehydratase [Thiomicrorhabdus xiamenensis]|uniref:Bifunctional chorismate mutase/prephenate dehydratase n=1 Tax=Thiomicrorhabdus xiamenensis TaxID=2739063 RepID=A0A7D4NKC2_9GAMM|nr:prephenate dehydratase [Thiomicrorhabdus xiamenensis]QKI89129.1 prephenate dehydratase [Thiomicrorhabdus xiamenensis]
MTKTTAQSVSEQEQLTEIRNQIDAIDQQIQQLIGERAACAHKVAEIKTQGGKVDAVFYRPEREAQVLRAVKERNDSLLPDKEMAKLFREIMSTCLALEQPISVAYLGPEGSYSHSSVIKQFGTAAHPVAVSSIEEVFSVVEKGEVNYGIVPVENSTEGEVKATQDELLKSSLKVSGELELAVDHCLLSHATSSDKVSKVLAHQQALGQCREWLKNNLPWAELEAVSSNAAAAKIAQEDPSVAAIASEQAADLYQLPILEYHISDSKANTTRFWVLGREDVEPSGEDKTALVLSIKNEAGALLKILDAFAKRHINMTRIISRPSKSKNWDYVFFIDLIGHQHDENLKEALQEVVEQAAFVKILGSFPISPL